MSSGRLPTSEVANEVVDAMVHAARGEELTRSYRVGDLLRLSELSIGHESQAHLRARFQLVDGRCAVSGQVTAELGAVCQRCLQLVKIAVDDRFHVMLVDSEADMNELPKAQDSVIAKSEQLDLKWLTEEQLLLAVPLVPLHAKREECDFGASEKIPHADKRNTPFAQLRELLKK